MRLSEDGSGEWPWCCLCNKWSSYYHNRSRKHLNRVKEAQEQKGMTLAEMLAKVQQAAPGPEPREGGSNADSGPSAPAPQRGPSAPAPQRPTPEMLAAWKFEHLDVDWATVEPVFEQVD